LPRILFSQTTYAYRQIDFPGAGFPGTLVTGINDAGEIVGYYYGAHAYFHGFTLIKGVFTAMGFPDPQIQSSIDAINDCGSMVGHIVYNGNPAYPMYQSFLATNGKFALLNYPGAVSTLAGGINNYGVISGTYDLTDYTGFLLSQGEFRTPVNLPPYPTGINDLGDEVGYYCPGNPTCYGSGTFTGFLYNQRTQTVFPIAFPGNAIPTIATGINNSGEIVGFYYPAIGNPQGFLYSNGRFTTIAVPGASGTLPNSINNAGVIAGSFGGPTGIQHGFIATPQTHPAEPPAPESGCSQ
jgi:probable HAF family extracellular repeat protein